MINSRVIPVLLLRDKGLYKGIRYRDHQYVGDPINTIKIFNEKYVDELILINISGEPYRDTGYLKEVISEAFIPITFGGGVVSIEQAERLFYLGVEKITVNTQAVLDRMFVKNLVKTFGSQSIVFSLDYKKKGWSGYRVCIRNGSEKTVYTPEAMAKIMEDAGVGEILLNDIDRDGTRQGYNLAMIQRISQSVRVPVIAGCGAGSLEHFKEALAHGADACAAGSYFVYHGVHRAVLISYLSKQEKDHLLKNKRVLK